MSHYRNSPGNLLKMLTALSVFALVSFGAAGLIVSALPERFTLGVLIGWILAVYVFGKFLRY